VVVEEGVEVMGWVGEGVGDGGEDALAAAEGDDPVVGEGDAWGGEGRSRGRPGSAGRATGNLV
jgi:hypothetical protein